MAITELRNMSVELWNTVTRIADGSEQDAQDEAVLKRAIETMRGEEAWNEWIGNQARGPAPKLQGLSRCYWLDVIGEASRPLEVDVLIGNSPSTMLSRLAERLEQVANGDRQMAKDLDTLMARIAMLVEIQGL